MTASSPTPHRLGRPGRSLAGGRPLRLRRADALQLLALSWRCSPASCASPPSAWRHPPSSEPGFGGPVISIVFFVLLFSLAVYRSSLARRSPVSDWFLSAPDHATFAPFDLRPGSRRGPGTTSRHGDLGVVGAFVALRRFRWAPMKADLSLARGDIRRRTPNRRRAASPMVGNGWADAVWRSGLKRTWPPRPLRHTGRGCAEHDHVGVGKRAATCPGGRLESAVVEHGDANPSSSSSTVSGRRVTSSCRCSRAPRRTEPVVRTKQGRRHLSRRRHAGPGRPQ